LTPTKRVFFQTTSQLRRTLSSPVLRSIEDTVDNCICETLVEKMPDERRDEQCAFVVAHVVIEGNPTERRGHHGAQHRACSSSSA
jgi:hypothetical protein